MDERRRYYRERHDPSKVPTTLTLEEVASYLSGAIRSATEIAQSNDYGGVDFYLALRTEVGIDTGEFTLPDLIEHMDAADLFSVLEFLHEKCHGQAAARLQQRADQVLAHYGDGYKFDDAGNIVWTGRAGLAETLDRKAPPAETEPNRQKLDEAVYLFRRPGSTRQNRKDAVRLLWEIVEYSKPKLQRDPKAETKVLGNFVQHGAIRHHDLGQDDTYPDATLEWVFVRYLATVHLYWDLQELGAEG